MEIIIGKESIDMEKGSSISIERTNPLFNDQGSKSLPFSIKRTHRNDLLLDFPEKHHRRNKYAVKQLVRLQSGTFSTDATMEMLSVDGQKVECALYLDETTFYQRVRETNLSEVFTGITRWDEGLPENLSDAQRAAQIEKILDILEANLRNMNNYSDDFAVFPAVSECELVPRVALQPMATARREQIINPIVVIEEPGSSRPIYGPRETYTYRDSDNNEITLPAGYGAAPFLRFGYVLRKIFEHFSLYLEPTVFETENKYRTWVVLHNTMDAILGGRVFENQLVPDCTVNDFLDIVREGLCADFFIDTNQKTARLVLFNDVLDAEADTDLTPYLRAAPPKLNLAVPKQVKLTVKRGLPLAEAAAPSIEEFRKKFPDYNTPLFQARGVSLLFSQNSAWRFSDYLPAIFFGSSKADRLGSINFDYDPPGNTDREEHKIPLESLASVSLSVNLMINVPVVGGIRNLNSFVVLDTEKQAEDELTCPMMLALDKASGTYRSGVQTFRGNTPLSDFPLYTPFETSLLTWDEYGLYNTFWKQYDELLQHSFHEITYNLRLPVYLLHNFRFDRLKIIEGQPLFPVSVKYKMEDKAFADVEILFRTVKLYEEVVYLKKLS